jgi:hypothetical protein
MSNIKVGQKVRLTKRKNGKQRGNAYPVLAVSPRRVLLGHTERPDKWFDRRDVS